MKSTLSLRLGPEPHPVIRIHQHRVGRGDRKLFGGHNSLGVIEKCSRRGLGMSSHRLPFQKSAQRPARGGNVEQLWGQAHPSLSTSSLSDPEFDIYQIRTNSLVHSAASARTRCQLVKKTNIEVREETKISKEGPCPPRSLKLDRAERTEKNTPMESLQTVLPICREALPDGKSRLTISH